MGFIFEAWPYRCTTSTALVLSVIFSSILLASILKYSSGSTKTGVAPFSVIPITLAIYVLPWTMTSSPSPILSALNAIHKASSPLASPTQYFAPMYAANSFSNSLTSFPSIYQPERRT